MRIVALKSNRALLWERKRNNYSQNSVSFGLVGRDISWYVRSVLGRLFVLWLKKDLLLYIVARSMAIKKTYGLDSTSTLDEFATKFRSNERGLQSYIDQMIENFHIYHEKLQRTVESSLLPDIFST